MMPPILLFGIHVTLSQIPHFGYLTLPRIYWTILVLLTVIYIVLHGKGSVRLGRSLKYTAILAFIIVYSLISLKSAMNFESSLNKFMFQLSGLATVFYITAFTDNAEDLKKFLRVLTICFAVTAVIGIYEMYSKNYLFNPSAAMLPKRNVYGRRYPCAVFYNTNDLATFLTVFSPFAVFTIADWAKGITGKVLGFILSALVFMNLLGGRARTSFFVILAFGVLVFLICAAVKNFRKYTLNVIIFILGLPFAEFILRITEIKKGTVISKINTINTSDYSVNERIKITLSGLKMSASHLLCGVGVGNSVPLLPKYAKVRAINLHNTPLEILAEFGIVVFILYAVMVILPAVDLIKNSSEIPKWRLFCVLCCIMLLAFQVESMQPSDALHISALWILFGIVFAADKIFCQKRENRYEMNGGIRFYLKKLFNKGCR
ncbi:MAG TPA: O-antigen ligase family protein [Ruminiclostridium sp.]|nr:O-antigen ligase family protein [Ruminiclostridium sp.]